MITKRLMMPNGREIQIALRYFDDILYYNGGSSVILKMLAP